jgi:hypothetical protein
MGVTPSDGSHGCQSLLAATIGTLPACLLSTPPFPEIKGNGVMGLKPIGTPS